MSIPSSKPEVETLRPSFPFLAPSQRPYTFISYGLPFDTTATKHIHPSGLISAQRAYIIASKSLASQTDAVTRLETALGTRHAGTWLGIPAHTPFDALVPIMQDMRLKKADCLITIGGGSLADGAKAIIYFLANNLLTPSSITSHVLHFLKISPEDMQRGIGSAPTIPLVFLPTTLSGAEYSKYAGITNPANEMKIQISHPGMYAHLLILDPSLCLTTPEKIWRSTGVRAIDHCVENICSTNATPSSDSACERGLVRLILSLLAYSHNPENLAARLESQLGCNDAMTGLTLLVMCGASHGIGHLLGPLGVGHGETSCILLPAVMKYNARPNAPQQDTIKRILWDEEVIAEVLRRWGLKREASDAGDALRAIFDELGMPRSLGDVGVGREKWDRLARNSLTDIFCKVNPVPLEREEQVVEILEMVAG